MKKVTAEEMHDVFIQADRAAQTTTNNDMFRHVPDQWDECSEQQQKIFQQMAFKLNCIVGEFSTEQ